ncbi:MAG: hypothetical protein K8T10_14495 [Candidatus Eremiobacteraeota bacterium]|nr:hypothetical protein [Candidatus Eremiobacteraeota bacterium]
MNCPIIKKIEIYKTEEQYRAPVPAGSFTLKKRYSIFIHITARLGNKTYEGWGEGSQFHPFFTGETCEQMTDDVEKRIAPHIIGMEIHSVRGVLDLINKLKGMKYDYLCTLSAVDMALFDLLGQFRQASVFSMIRKFLQMEPIEENFPNMPISLCLDFIKPDSESGIDEIIKKADKLAGDGYRFFEVPLYKHSDLAYVNNMISRINEKLHLSFPGIKFSFSIHAGEVFSEIEEIRDIKQNDFAGVSHFIQPFHRDIPHYSFLLKEMLREQDDKLSVFSDQGASSVERIRNLVESGSVDGIVVKMGRSGGFSFIVELYNFLLKYPGIPLAFSSLFESGLGTAANIHASLVLHESGLRDSGYGFDGFSRVAGDKYCHGKDAIKYINPDKGWTDIDGSGCMVFGSLQAVGNTKGLGQEINMDYILSNTHKASIISRRNEKIVIHRFPYRKGSPDNRNVETEIMNVGN